MPQQYEGILPIIKPTGKTSFSLVAQLRKLTRIKKIGHSGTLDPFASGVMILLIGRQYTRLADKIQSEEKEYRATIHLGITTDTYDTEGVSIAHSPYIPSTEQVEQTLLQFQGTILQTPPMFSAKKVQGQKLYELARKGITIERTAVPVTLHITLLSYHYPQLDIHVRCSKGTYIRSLAFDIGEQLGCGAHLSQLIRTKNGCFSLDDCCDALQLADATYDWTSYLKT